VSACFFLKKSNKLSNLHELSFAVQQEQQLPCFPYFSHFPYFSRPARQLICMSWDLSGDEGEKLCHSLTMIQKAGNQGKARQFV